MGGDFESYIRRGEPDKKEKDSAWKTAIGLQDIDGLKTSDYLNDTAIKHIEGDISIDDVKTLIDGFYQSKSVLTRQVPFKPKCKYFRTTVVYQRNA